MERGDTAASYRLELHTTATVEQTEHGRWAAWHGGLGLTVYGDSGATALERFQQAVSSLFEVVLNHGGVDAARARFDKAGVKYSISEIVETPLSRKVRIDLTTHKTLEPAG